MENLRQKELRIAFAGTPELASSILGSLLEKSRHQITMVLTQPDRPAGRGRKFVASAVKILALENDLPVFQPLKSELTTLENRISETDLMIVAAYGMLLPESILSAPTYGCINVHTSLLPRWRGAAPIQRAIQAGDCETGISIMQMDSGLDTGPVLLQKKCPINATDTSASLLIKLADIGSECLLEVLDLVASAKLQPTIQDESLANYAKKIIKSEARIDWSQTAVTIDRAIRAFNPAPICYTELAGIPLRIWQAEILDHDSPSTAGKILSCHSAGIDVATGQGVLRILTLQPQGKRTMSVADFLNGNPAFGVSN
ncbi:MAG: methionyl-tRNA formyltransferase [Gammaproteobacteria bacterium]|jgi:methionyl-tRNA formyltransferase